MKLRACTLIIMILVVASPALGDQVTGVIEEIFDYGTLLGVKLDTSPTYFVESDRTLMEEIRNYWQNQAEITLDYTGQNINFIEVSQSEIQYDRKYLNALTGLAGMIVASLFIYGLNRATT